MNILSIVRLEAVRSDVLAAPKATTMWMQVPAVRFIDDAYGASRTTRNRKRDSERG